MPFFSTPDGARHEAHLRLLFESRGEKTVLARSYARMPLRVFPPFHASDHGCAYTYVVNPTPGFLSGDRVGVEMAVEPGAHAFVATPSATKVLAATGERAEQTTLLRVAEGAVLEYVPSYVIPFAGSRYAQRTMVELGKGATCLLLDWFATGRTSAGESLAFDEYESLTSFVSEGEPVVYDRFVLRPRDEKYQAMGRLGTHTVCASLYLVCDRPPLLGVLVENARRVLAGQAVLSGVSTFDPGGLVVRILGESVPVVQSRLIPVLAAIRETLFGAVGDGQLRRMLGPQ